MQGHEGFIAIFSDSDWTGTVLTNPQVLYADSEEFSVGKEIKQKPFQVSNSRVKGTGALVSGPIKPQGAITYQFRSDDCVKVFMSHFQMGTLFETGSSEGGTFHYGFYPSRKSPSYTADTGYGEGSYGAEPGYAYSVSFLKKYTETTQYGGTNSILFRHGICDKLRVALSTDRDAKLTGDFKFRDLDHGTAVPHLPGTAQVGSYSTKRSFSGWSATALVAGASLPLMDLMFESSNGLEEKSRVGRLSPEIFPFGEYSLKGAFNLDLPKDALKYIGSMFALRDFSIVATLYNGTADQVVFDLPTCKYQTFDWNNKGGNEEVSSSIPFQAFSVGNAYPIRVSVKTDYDFEGIDLFMDATDGARTVADHEDLDAEDGARVLADYEIMDRDV
jgi:hypothetical protein